MTLGGYSSFVLARDGNEATAGDAVVLDAFVLDTVGTDPTLR